jgi:hypothetical protein
MVMQTIFRRECDEGFGNNATKDVRDELALG